MKKRKVIAVVLLGLGMLCGAVGIMKYIEEKNAGKEYEEIKEEVTKEVQENRQILRMRKKHQRCQSRFL